MPQRPMVRKKQKARRTKQLAAWRQKQEAEQVPQAQRAAETKPAKK